MYRSEFLLMAPFDLLLSVFLKRLFSFVEYRLVPQLGYRPTEGYYHVYGQ